MNRTARFITAACFALLTGVEAKQLAPSWQGKAAKDVRSAQTPAGLVWVLSYENPAETDRAKRNVYIFFDEFGNFIGGNHSGKIQ